MCARSPCLLSLALCAVALAVWVSVTSAGGEKAGGPAKAGSTATNPQSVSLIQLIANPQTFDGKYVRILGFVRIEHEGTAIYLHREDWENMLTDNGLWLEANDVAAAGSKEAQVNTRYALVEGRFSAKKRGHMGLWSGSIEQITRMIPWNIRKAKK